MQRQHARYGVGPAADALAAAAAMVDDGGNNNIFYEQQPQQQQQQQQQRSRYMVGSTSINSNGVIHPTSISTRQCLSWSRVMTSSKILGGLADSRIGGVGAVQQVPPPRSGAASVVVKGKLYVFGGYGGGTGRLDDFWSYDFDAQTWEEVQVLSAEKPGCRENNGVVISDSSRSIYLFGGYNGTSLFMS
jgi:Kelch motif